MGVKKTDFSKAKLNRGLGGEALRLRMAGVDKLNTQFFFVKR